MKVFKHATAALLSLVLLLPTESCKKSGYGSLRHSIRYTTEKNVFRMLQFSDTTHTGLGNYIGSITPQKFTAKLNIMNYTDRWDWGDPAFHGVGYIESSDSTEVAQYADFSGNREVSLNASLGSRDLIEGDNGSAALFRQKEVTLTYFNLNIFYFYQEMELPAQYRDVNLDQFNRYYNEWIKSNYGGSIYSCDTMKSGTFLKSRNAPFSNPLFDGFYMTTFVFGNTDSTFIFNREQRVLYPSENFPFPTSGWRSMVVRSHKFTPVTLIMPEEGESVTLHSTLVFDTENLIQLYAGKDNIPYTSDDVLVYAPNFWERIKVKLEMR